MASSSNRQALRAEMSNHYIRYSLYRFFRVQIRLMLGAFAVAAIILDVVAAKGSQGGTNGPPLIVFAAFYTFCVAWAAYWFGLRIVFWLEIRDGKLSWRSGIRSGSVPVSDIRRISTSKLMSGMGVIRTLNGRVFVWPTQHYPAFADRMGQLYPDIDVRVGKLARFGARMTGHFAPKANSGSWWSMVFEEGDDGGAH